MRLGKRTLLVGSNYMVVAAPLRPIKVDRWLFSRWVKSWGDSGVGVSCKVQRIRILVGTDSLDRLHSASA